MNKQIVSGVCAILSGVAVCGCSSQTDAEYEAKRVALLNKPRIILWDDDGCDMTHYPIRSEYLLKEPKTPATFEKVMLEATKGTKTDVVCYSGTMGFGYFTMAKAGDQITHRVADPGSVLTNAVEAYNALGTDALKMAADYAHRNGQEIFCSLRFNDNHDAGSRPGKPNEHFSPWKQAHMDCLVTKPPEYKGKCCGWCAADFAMEETRKFCKKYVREFFENYDLDGFLYDFFRHPQLFASVAAGGHATQKDLATMTQLMKELRDIAEEVGRKRGRPFVLGMRVPDSVEYCKAIGIDLEAWLEAGVVDYVIAAGYFQLKPWKASADLAHRYGVKCYSSIDESRIYAKRRILGRNKIEARLARAAASIVDGMDGTYYFNFEYALHDIQRKLLSIDPRDCDGEDKFYFSTYAGGGGYMPNSFLVGGQDYFDIPGINPTFPQKVAAGAKYAFPLTMADDFKKAAAKGKSAVIQVLVSADAKEAPKVTVNGKTLKGAVDQNGIYRYPADASVFVKGPNAIELVSAGGMTLHDFAIQVHFVAKEPGRELVSSNFAKGTDGWKITNNQNFLTIAVTNREDGAALVFANDNTKRGLNTCFYLCSDFFAVAPNTDIAVVTEAKGDISMLGAFSGGEVASGVKWFDKDKKPLLIQDVLGKMVPNAFSFGFESLGASWCKSVNQTVVPEGAAFAKVQLGGTEPDIPAGSRVEIRRVTVRARVPGEGWDFGDLEPPKVKLLTQTPNPDPKALLRFNFTDASGLDRNSITCWLDGTNVTAQLKPGWEDEFSLPQSKPWEKDSLHLVKFVACDVCGNRMQETLAFFCGKRMTKELVTLRDDGMTLIDGKPFFPIAPFSFKRCVCNDNNLEKGLLDLKAIGVNAVHTYDFYEFGEKQKYGRHQEYLDIIKACEKTGMKLIVEAGDRDYKNPERPARLREIMLNARDYTCVLAWGLGDDTANYRNGADIQVDDNIIKAIDNARLTTQADITTYAGRYRPYVHATDTIMTEIYPFKALVPEPAGLANVVKYMKFAYADKKYVGDPVRGIWPLVQAFKGWGAWKRFPTKEEIRAQTYLGIIHGGRGVTYYTYYSKGDDREGVAQHMDSFGATTRELQAIYDDLTSYDAKVQPKVEVVEGPKLDLGGNASVTCLLKEGEKGKGALLMAGNAVTDRSVKVKIALPAKSVETLFENGRKVTVENGRLVDTFGPGEIHVYRLR